MLIVSEYLQEIFLPRRTKQFSVLNSYGGEIKPHWCGGPEEGSHGIDTGSSANLLLRPWSFQITSSLWRSSLWRRIRQWVAEACDTAVTEPLCPQSKMQFGSGWNSWGSGAGATSETCRSFYSGTVLGKSTKILWFDETQQKFINKMNDANRFKSYTQYCAYLRRFY